MTECFDTLNVGFFICFDVQFTLIKFSSLTVSKSFFSVSHTFEFLVQSKARSLGPFSSLALVILLFIIWTIPFLYYYFFISSFDFSGDRSNCSAIFWWFVCDGHRFDNKEKFWRARSCRVLEKNCKFTYNLCIHCVVIISNRSLFLLRIFFFQYQSQNLEIGYIT